jgi:hypothetical protein
VQLVLLQALLQEPVTGDVLQLLQSVDLRQLVLQREPILGVYVRNEFSQRSLRLEDQGLPEVGHLQLLELLQAGQGVRAEPRPQRRDPAIVLGKTGLVAGLGRDATYLRGELAVLQLVQEIDGLAVAVAADDDVADVVDHAAQLQGRGLVGGQLVEEVLRMGDDVARVSHDEHVAHVGLREPRGDHPAVDAGEEHGFRGWVVFHLHELLHHLLLFHAPVPHYTSEDAVHVNNEQQVAGPPLPRADSKVAINIEFN